MKTRLLTLIDLSEDASVVLDFCNKWAKGDSTEVHLLHQVVGMMPALTDAKSKELILEAEKAEAEILLKDLSKKSFPLSTFPMLHITDENIIKYARNLVQDSSFDLMVVGLKKTSLLKKFLIGTVVTHLIDLVDRPVIGLPLDGVAKLPERLIISVNYQYPVNFETLKELIISFKIRGLKEIYLVSASASNEDLTNADEYVKSLHDSLKELIHVTSEILVDADLLTELKRLTSEAPGAMLVVQKGSRSFLDHLFRKFLINELVHDGQTPLIVLP
jgi:nucleotide-binding universal stress UspA family protein